MKKSKFLKFSLVVLGVGIGAFLYKKYKEKKRMKNENEDFDLWDDNFNDEDFFCDVEYLNNCEKPNQEDYVSIAINKEMSEEIVVDSKDENNDEMKECGSNVVVECEDDNHKENDINCLLENKRNELLLEREKIIEEREQLFAEKREGLVAGKEFKEKRKLLGEKENEINRQLAKLKNGEV